MKGHLEYLKCEVDQELKRQSDYLLKNIKNMFYYICYDYIVLTKVFTEILKC